VPRAIPRAEHTGEDAWGTRTMAYPRLMRVLLYLSVLWAAVGAAAAQQYPIVELNASGSEFYPEKDILAYSGLAVDKTKPIPLSEVLSAAQKIVNSGVFKEVSYQHTKIPGGMRVTFLLKDKEEEEFVPASFQNIVWLSAEELAKELHERVPLFTTHVPLSGSLKDEVAAALKDILAARNVSAHISAEAFTKTSGTPDEIQFSADDRTVMIGRVEATGVSPTFAAPVTAALKKLEGVPFQRSTIQNFAETNLRKVYAQKGYLKAAFTAPQHKVIEDKPNGETDVLITIPITEGREYQLAAPLRFSGATVLKPADLERHVHSFPGLPMNADLLGYELRTLRTEYARRGYMHMTATPKPTFNEAAGTVTYDIVIKEGPLFRMGEVEVAGLSKDSEELIRNAWKLRPGDPFDLTYLTGFASQFKLPDGAAYVIEQSEGAEPQTVDVTFVFCKQQAACKPVADQLREEEGEKVPRSR
jgi:outer membrane protein assembly factor BamA